MKQKIIIIGASSFGKVIYDTITSQNKYDVVGFADSSLAIGTNVISNRAVIATASNAETLTQIAECFIVALEDNNDRKRMFDATKKHLSPAIVIHPSAVIGSEVTVGEGSIVLAHAVVHSSIGRNTIVKPGVIIDHDCVIGNDAHIGTGTFLKSPYGTFGSDSIIISDRQSTFGQSPQILMPQPILLKGKGNLIGVFVVFILFAAVVISIFLLQ